MTEFTLHTMETAPQASRPTLEMVTKRFGFVPNVLREMAEEPAALTGAVQLLGLLDESSLAPEEQWVVLLTVSSEINSDYCVAANSTVATVSKVEAEIIEAVRTRGPLPSPKLEALRTLVSEMIHERGRASQTTLQRFFDAGFDKAQLFAVLLGVATETLASYTDRLTGVPMDEQFRPFTWTRELA